MPHEAFFHALFQRTPCLHEVRVVVNHAPVGIFGERVAPGTKAERPMNEVEVDVVQL